MVRRKGRWLGLFLASALIAPETGSAFSRARDHRPDAAAGILAAFQGSCGSQGAFTQAANAQTNSIINIIQTLKNTDACKPYVSQLTSIQTAANQIQSLENSPSYATYQTDQRNYQILTLALANATPGSPEALNLQNMMTSLRSQMYGDQAAYDTSTRTSQHNLIVSQASSMLDWGQTLATTSESPGLAQCLRQSPAAALELSTHLAAFGGSFLPGVYGAAVSVVGQLLTAGLEVLRRDQYDRAIFDAQSNQMPDALGCALESMTESYCGADDSYKLLDLARRNRLADYTATPLWRGIDIVSRQLPGLLQWLGGVQNEVPPQDSYQASKQNSVLQEIFLVQQQDLNSKAAIYNALDQANAARTFSAKLAAVVNAITGMAQQLVAPNIVLTSSTSGTSTPTPFGLFQPSPHMWACWLVVGPESPCPAVPTVDQNPTGSASLQQLTDYVENTLGLNNPAQLAVVESQLLSNWKALVPKVQVLVDADFARIMATNAGAILASAFVASNGNPLPPYEVLLNISKFLQGMLEYPAKNPLLPLELTQEKFKVDQTIRQLTEPDSVVCPPIEPPRVAVIPQSPGGVVPAPTPTPNPSPIPLTPEQCQTQRLVTIFNLFTLQNGTQVFLTDMNNLVNIDLQDRFKAGEIPNEQAKILQASGEDLFVALESAGSRDLDPIADDLAGARADIEGNIQTFRQFFVGSFRNVVKRESELGAQESSDEGPNRPHGQRLGELCMLWLLTSDIPKSKFSTLDNWPDLKTQKLCEKTLYFNENVNSKPGEEEAAFDLHKLVSKVGSLPFRKRVCTFHNFKIQNRAATLFARPAGH